MINGNWTERIPTDHTTNTSTTPTATTTAEPTTTTRSSSCNYSATIIRFTCYGDYNDPHLNQRLTHVVGRLKQLCTMGTKSIRLRKIEPWNSVRVTVSLPRDAAQRLRELAQRSDDALRDLGILSVQLEGDQVIALTLRTTAPTSVQPSASSSSNSSSSSSSSSTSTSSASSSSPPVNNSRSQSDCVGSSNNNNSTSNNNDTSSNNSSNNNNNNNNNNNTSSSDSTNSSNGHTQSTSSTVTSASLHTSINDSTQSRQSIGLAASHNNSPRKGDRLINNNSNNNNTNHNNSSLLSTTNGVIRNKPSSSLATTNTISTIDSTTTPDLLHINENDLSSLLQFDTNKNLRAGSDLNQASSLSLLELDDSSFLHPTDFNATDFMSSLDRLNEDIATEYDIR